MKQRHLVWLIGATLILLFLGVMNRWFYSANNNWYIAFFAGGISFFAFEVNSRIYDLLKLRDMMLFLKENGIELNVLEEGKEKSE